MLWNLNTALVFFIYPNALKWHAKKVSFSPHMSILMSFLFYLLDILFLFVQCKNYPFKMEEHQ